MSPNARILVVDREEKSLRSLNGLLKGAGFETALASDAPAAAEKAKTFRPDLCIVDPRIQTGDGSSFSKRLIEQNPRLPVIISMEGGGSKYRRVAEQYGAAAYLERPCRNEELLETIQSVLGRQEGDDLDDTVRDALDDVAKEGFTAEEIDRALEGTLDNFDFKSGKTAPKAKTADKKGPFGGKQKNGTKEKQAEQPGMTMRVDPDDLKKEMDKMRAEKPKTSAGSRVRFTQTDRKVSVTDSDVFTSNDIFGELIDDLEAPVRVAAQVGEKEPEPASVSVPPVVEEPVAEVSEPIPSPFSTQPVPEEERELVQKVQAQQAEREKRKRDKAAGKATGGEKISAPGGTNEYQLLNKIAAGGMAEVWKAKLIGEKGFEKIVAIKKILAHLSDNEEFISMFIDEAKVAANLTHPNIAQIYELGKLGDSFFIAMEYVGGHNLRTILNQCNQMKVRMAPEIVVFIGMKLCNALHYAHNKKGYDNKPLHIVHRDVSPQNILLSAEGEIKLVDFGIAKASIKATQTVAGSLKGKLLYMSPEQAEGKGLDRRSDIFSLAAVLYESLTGKKLFAGDSELSILKNVRNADFDSPRAVNPDIPVKLETILMRALAKDTDERYDSAKALESDFKEYLKQEKIHINESDVADYLRLIIQKDVEKLRALSRRKPSKAEPEPEVPAPAQTIPASAPAASDAAAKSDVVMPDTGQYKAFEGGGGGKSEKSGLGKWIALGAAGLIVVAVILWFLLAGGSSEQAGLDPWEGKTMLAEIGPCPDLPVEVLG